MQRFIVGAERVLISLLWFLGTPLLFLTLYATIEMQAEAKAEVQAPTGIPTIYVVAHAEHLRDLDLIIGAQAQLVTRLAATLDKDRIAYIAAKNDLLADLFALAVDDPKPPDFGACHADRDATIGCHDTIVLAAQRRMIGQPPEARGAGQAMLKDTQARFARFLGLSSQTQDELRILGDAKTRLELLQADQTAQIGPSDSKLRAMTESYAEMSRKLPLFGTFFLFPEGAVVAAFTGVMGAVGAAVFSLYGRLRPTSPTRDEDLVRSYVTRPLLGALAGFMVYFVISAGAAFLIQPQANITNTVNGLSPAALASLGLFAGIAAENVLRWLAAQAANIFKLDEG